MGRKTYDNLELSILTPETDNFYNIVKMTNITGRTFTMKISALITVVFSFVLSLSAFEIEKLNSENLLMPKIDLPAAKASKADAPENRQIYLWMTIRGTGLSGEVEADDPFARINVSVRRVFDDEYDVRSRVDMDYEWLRIRKYFQDDWQLSGSGFYLNMRKSLDDYYISGNVVQEDNYNKYVNIRMYKRFSSDDEDFSYDIYDHGINLNIDERGINGYFQTQEYSKKTVAAVISFVLALHDQVFNKPGQEPKK